MTPPPLPWLNAATCIRSTAHPEPHANRRGAFVFESAAVGVAEAGAVEPALTRSHGRPTHHVLLSLAS